MDGYFRVVTLPSSLSRGERLLLGLHRRLERLDEALGGKVCGKNPDVGRGLDFSSLRVFLRGSVEKDRV
jgi:hypothetical protein